MKSLFPSNHKAGLLVDCCYHDVSNYLTKWLASVLPNKRVNIAHYKGTKEVYFNILDTTRLFTPNTIVLTKYDSFRCVYYDNHLHQYEPQSDNSKICESLRVNTCYLHYDHISQSPFYQSAIFSRYWHDGKKVNHRYVSSVKDKSWQFTQSGSSLPFECTDRYSLRLKKDRLTCDMLVEYARSIGYDLAMLSELSEYYIIRIETGANQMHNIPHGTSVLVQ